MAHPESANAAPAIPNRNTAVMTVPDRTTMSKLLQAKG